MRGLRALLVALLLVGAGVTASARSSKANAKKAAAAAKARASRTAAVGGCSGPDGRAKHVLFVSLTMGSHVQPLNYMAGELRERGCRVSFAIPEDGRKLVSAGIDVISSGPSAVPPRELRLRFRQLSHDPAPFGGLLASFSDVLLPSVAPMFKALRPFVQSDPPDLMIVDVCALAGLMLAQHYNVPHAVNNPSLLITPGEASAAVPAWGSGLGAAMTLAERCVNAVFPRLLATAIIPPFMQLNKVRWELHLELYRSQHEIFRNVPIITNTAFGLEYPRSLSPLIKMVGPVLPTQLPAIPASVTAWLAASELPVVLVHFGTRVYLEPWQVKEVVDGLRSDAHRVVWVMSKSQRQAVPYTPGSFLLHVTLPYLAIAGHPLVKAVVSHCEFDAAQEALYFGKPLLCMPFFLSQPDVTARIVSVGAGVLLDKESLTACGVKHKLHTLVSNASFTQRAVVLSKVLVRAGGTKRVVGLLEEMLAIGSEHWRSPDIDMPWHRRKKLDIYAVFAAFALLSGLGLHAIAKQLERSGATKPGTEVDAGQAVATATAVEAVAAVPAAPTADGAAVQAEETGHGASSPDKGRDNTAASPGQAEMSARPKTE